MKINSEKNGDIVVLQVEGSVTSDNSGGLVAQFKSLINGPCRACILDMSGLEQLDSSGIGALASCVEAAQEKPVEVRIAGLAGRALQAVQLAKADRFLKLHPDVESALVDLRQA